MGEISLVQAIRNAIETELAAERFYRGMIDKGDDVEARAFLARVADQEHGHAERIADFAERIDRGELPESSSGPVEVIETDPDWAALDELDLRAAVTMAIQLETTARKYYELLAAMSSGELRSFFATLVRVEEEHRQGFVELLELL